MDQNSAIARRERRIAALGYAKMILHMLEGGHDGADPTGDELVRMLSTLANPHRLRIIAILIGRRDYVSRLARELGISRPLLQVHLRRLEAVGLVSSTVEVSKDGHAMKFYEVNPFVLHLTPEAIAIAARTLTAGASDGDEERGRPASRRGAQS